MILEKATNLATQRVLRDKIAAQIEVYLANGGKITDLPGFQTTPPRCLPVRIKQTNNPA